MFIMLVSALLLHLLADYKVKMKMLWKYSIREMHRDLTCNVKDTATVHLVRTTASKKAKHERCGKLDSKFLNDNSNHTSTHSFIRKFFLLVLKFS